MRPGDPPLASRRGHPRPGRPRRCRRPPGNRRAGAPAPLAVRRRHRRAGDDHDGGRRARCRRARRGRTGADHRPRRRHRAGRPPGRTAAREHLPADRLQRRQGQPGHHAGDRRAHGHRCVDHGHPPGRRPRRSGVAVRRGDDGPCGPQRCPAVAGPPQRRRHHARRRLPARADDGVGRPAVQLLRQRRRPGGERRPVPPGAVRRLLRRHAEPPGLRPPRLPHARQLPRPRRRVPAGHHRGLRPRRAHRRQHGAGRQRGRAGRDAVRCGDLPPPPLLRRQRRASRRPAACRCPRPTW